MTASSGMDVKPTFWPRQQVGCERSASRSGRFTPRERDPSTHWIWGCVVPRAGLDDMEKRNFLTLPEMELRPHIIQLVASRYTHWAETAHILNYI
jgi:hypothetical protein